MINLYIKFEVSTFTHYEDMKSNVKGRGVVCMILHLAVLVEQQLVTDGQIDGYSI